MARLNAEIKDEIYDEFADHVKYTGRSLSDVVRELINRWNVKQRRLDGRRAVHEKELLDGTYGKDSGWGEEDDD